jgi:hypothetical protein
VTSAAGDVVIAGGVMSVTTNGGNVAQGGAGTLRVGNTDGTGSLTINTSGTTAGTVTLPEVSGNGKNLNLTLNSGTANVTNVTAENININASTVNGNLTVSNPTGSITRGGAVTFVGSSRVVTLSAPASSKTITFEGIGDLSFAAITSNNVHADSAVNLTTSGPLATAGITATKVSLVAGGNITQTGAIVSSGTLTVDSTGGSVTLTGAGNTLANVVLKNSPSGITILEDNVSGLTLANGTNATGAVSIATAGGSIALGTASGNSLFFGSTLGLDTTNAGGTPAGADITDASDNVTVVGALTLRAGTAGDVVIDGGTTGASHFSALNHQFGQVNVVSAVDVTVWEKTTLNLGALAITGNLQAYSSTSIINTGRLQIGGTTTVGAGSAAAPGSVDLTFAAGVGAGNTFTGAISLLDDITPLGGVTIGNYLASGIAIRADSDIQLGIANNVFSQGMAGNISLTTTGAQTLTPGALNTTGSVTLASGTGNITATNGGNMFGAVTVNTGGSVSVSSANATNLTVNATLASTTPGQTAAFTASNGTLTIGNYISDFTGGTTFTTSTNKVIQDSVAGIGIFGNVTFSSTGGVNVNREGHTFGGVTISTGNNGSATIRESGTLRLLSVTTAGSGSFTATSTTGDIIQTTTGNGLSIGNSAASGTFTALQGKVTLNDNDNGGADGNRSASRYNITAAGDVVVMQAANTVLGNISTGGTLTVNAGVPANGAISQASGTKLDVYGAVDLIGNGTGSIAVGNTGNRMGAVSARTTSGNITLKELTTLNLRAISTSGNLTAESENDSIIDTVGTVAAGFTNSIVATGTSAFTANNGAITLGLANSNYVNASFVTTGNVSILDTILDLNLGASTVGGTLDVTNTAGNISQSGVLNIAGNTSFLATNAASSITLPNSDNRFGGVRFIVGTGGGIFNEVSTFNLRSGSLATGPVSISTGGDFVTSGNGGSSFTNNLSIAATGTIVPGSGSMLVTGTFTVFSPATKDLSGLSKSGNLAGKDPVNTGTGTYVPPAP